MKSNLKILGLILILYFIFFTWLDIPLMYLIYMGAEGSRLATLSSKISLIKPLYFFIFGLAAYAYSRYLHKKNQLRYTDPLSLWGEGVILAFFLTTAIKIILARYRPIELMTHNLYGFHFFSLNHNFNSTPSGHTAMTFAAFFGFARLFKKTGLSLILLTFATCMGLSRLIIADHYCSDVILGAYIGVFSVIWIEKFHPYFKHKD